VASLALALPLPAAAVLMLVGGPTVAANAYLQLINFAALALVGAAGAHFGFAAASARAPGGWYALVLVALVFAWAALSMISPIYRIAALAIGTFVVFVADRHSVRAGLAPAWYLPLRKLTASLVLGALLVALVAVARILMAR